MALMKKSDREFTEEVFLRSENLISKKKAFRKKVLLSVACLSLIIFIVPMQFMLGGASGGNSASYGEMNGAGSNEQEWKDAVDDRNSMDQIRQESNSFSQSEKKETCDQESSEQMATGLTCDTETESEDTETAITGEVLFDKEEVKDE